MNRQDYNMDYVWNNIMNKYKQLINRFINKQANNDNFTPRIVFTDAHNRNRVYEYVLEGCMVLGRVSKLSDIAFPEEPTVSGRQCRLYTEEGKVYVTDLGGTNPTYLNNKIIMEDTEVLSGDVLSFGEVDIYVEFKR